ncbi:MAG: putative transposase [Gammaproteobacteria bacterium]
MNARLDLLPSDAVIVGDSLAIQRDGDRIVFFNAAGPIFVCRQDDRTSIRVAAVTVIENGWAKKGELAKALGIHRATLHRDLRKFRKSGVEGLAEKRRGPKQAHTLTPELIQDAQRLLDRGESIRKTAAAIGMSNRGLQHGIARGLVSNPSSEKKETATAVEDCSAESLTGPRDRAEADQSCSLGVATKRGIDRVLASVGKLVEAKPEFEAMEAVPGAGALLALPALLDEGLLEVGKAVYASLKNGFFGLQSIFLSFAFMALLRIKTPEQLSEHAPGELGILLGLDRMPEVKTLRRKLRELGERQLADSFSRQLTERWAKAEPRELAVLYVDGHVRPYHGRKHVLPKQYVQQRGRSMPGTKDFHVNDRRADPLLAITVDANESLLATLDSVLLPEIRSLVGPNRNVTVAFDREGWSPELFAKWKSEGFDVLTYRKGDQSQWRTGFEKITGRVGGEMVEYCLAERQVKLSNGLKVREIRRKTDDGHQTAVITTNEKLPILAVAHRMFARWRQENFFRYMRHEFALDHLSTNAVEPADPQRLVTNPARAKLEKKRKAARTVRTRLIERRLKIVPGETVRVDKRKVGEEELDRLIEKRDAEIERLTKRIDKLPKRLLIKEVLPPEKIVKLERERKVLVDAIKLTAYRAESALARLVEPFFNRHEEEARKLLKTIFNATADVIPDHRAGELRVRFHGLANPRSTRALCDLCEIVNQSATVYPDTGLRLVFEAPTSQK